MNQPFGQNRFFFSIALLLPLLLSRKSGESVKQKHPIRSSRQNLTALFLFCLFPASGAVPPNDRCVDAFLLQPGVPLNGDVTEANFDFSSQGVCGPNSDRSGIWYEIIGSGGKVTVEVCTNNEDITNVGIFFECDANSCIGFPDQQDVVKSCANNDTIAYTFLANDGFDYYVQVRSDIFFGSGTQFTIVYTEEQREPGGERFCLEVGLPAFLKQYCCLQL